MPTSSEWTVEQATELLFEQILTLLDGCDDDDVVRPDLVLEAIRQAWSPTSEDALAEGMSAGELRRRSRRAISDLARGERHHA